MEHYGLIGNPIKHSFSESYFTDFFREHGIQAKYSAFCLDDINELETLICGDKDLIGLNVTSPFKCQCLKFIDELTLKAETVGAVNTILIDRSKRGKSGNYYLTGHNTDVEGFEAELDELMIPPSEEAVGEGKLTEEKRSPLYENGDEGAAETASAAVAVGEKSASISELRALVLGSGGAASAVCAALQFRGVKPTIVSRSAPKSDAENADCVDASERSRLLCTKALPTSMAGVPTVCYSQLDAEIMSAHRLIIDATPLGMGRFAGEAPQLPYELINEENICIDLVYNPAVTEFMRRCMERGASVRNGLAMLIGQAKASWQFWQER